jgi:hypothetical protein
VKIASHHEAMANLPSGPMMNPAGVCIQLLAAKIQNALKLAPNATMQQAKKWKPGRTRFTPKSITPMNPASRKNAVSTS